MFESGEQQRSTSPHLQGRTGIASDVDHIIARQCTSRIRPSELFSNSTTSIESTVLRNTVTKMAPPTDRKEILAAFRKQIESGTAIVGAGAGMPIPRSTIYARDNR